jgi:hypothetical protein
MEDIDVGLLIVGAISGIGIIQLIMWIVVVIRHPGYLKADLILPTIPAPRKSRERL